MPMSLTVKIKLKKKTAYRLKYMMVSRSLEVGGRHSVLTGVMWVRIFLIFFNSNFMGTNSNQL